MRSRVSGLELRALTSADERFIAMLSRRAFVRYAHRPVRTVLNMLEARDSDTFVAHLDEVPVGFAVVRLRAHLDYGPVEQPRLAHLDAIAVETMLRRRGVGRALLSHAEDHARSRDALAMFLMTASNNERARYLFNAADYQPFGGFGGAYRGRHHGVLLTKLLRLDPAATPALRT